MEPSVQLIAKDFVEVKCTLSLSVHRLKEQLDAVNALAVSTGEPIWISLVDLLQNLLGLVDEDQYELVVDEADINPVRLKWLQNLIKWVAPGEVVALVSRMTHDNYFVTIVSSRDTGEFMWAICDGVQPDFWLESFPTLDESIQFCRDMGLKVKSITDKVNSDDNDCWGCVMSRPKGLPCPMGNKECNDKCGCWTH